MIKIKATYSTMEEKRRFLQELEQNFEVINISKEYDGVHKRIHIDLENKENN